MDAHAKAVGGSKRGVFDTTADGSYVEKEEEEQSLIMSTADGGQLREMDFPSGKCQQSTWVSLDDGEELKQSGVSHIRVIHREQDDGRNTVALGKTWRVRRGHYGSTKRRRTEGHAAFREAAHVAEPVCPNEPTEEHGMWDGGGLHATDDDEKMDEDKEETDTEEIRDEEQEEEHQKARAIASPDLPSRREVEDDNLTHLPY